MRLARKDHPRGKLEQPRVPAALKSNMKLVEFLRDMASRTFRLSRTTLDLGTSTELQKMGKELKTKAEERAQELQRASNDNASRDKTDKS